MVLEKPVKMSFSIINLAKSSRDQDSNQTNAVVYNFNHSISISDQNDTPVKLQASTAPMTSTPVSVSRPNNQRQPKRKRDIDSIYSEDSSTDSSSSSSLLSSYTDDSDDQPRKKPRNIFTQYQVAELERQFNKSKFLPVEERPALAKRLNLSQLQVKTWFQNRRMKDKRQQKHAGQKMFLHHGVVNMGVPYPHILPSGSQSTQQSGHSAQQFSDSPAKTVYDHMCYMYGYGPISPVMYSGYNQHYYNGLSPQPLQHYRM